MVRLVQSCSFGQFLPADQGYFAYEKRASSVCHRARAPLLLFSTTTKPLERADGVAASGPRVPIASDEPTLRRRIRCREPFSRRRRVIARVLHRAHGYSERPQRRSRKREDWEREPCPAAGWQTPILTSIARAPAIRDSAYCGQLQETACERRATVRPAREIRRGGPSGWPARNPMPAQPQRPRCCFLRSAMPPRRCSTGHSDRGRSAEAAASRTLTTNDDRRRRTISLLCVQHAGPSPAAARSSATNSSRFDDLTGSDEEFLGQPIRP